MTFEFLIRSVMSTSWSCEAKLATTGSLSVTRSGGVPVATALIISAVSWVYGTSRASIRYSFCDSLNVLIPTWIMSVFGCRDARA